MKGLFWVMVEEEQNLLESLERLMIDLDDLEDEHEGLFRRVFFFPCYNS